MGDTILLILLYLWGAVAGYLLGRVFWRRVRTRRRKRLERG